ncbi:MAG: M3 family metallopeptidase [Bacteroidetes bacterium]|nr:M3 family metallopeptidase [Bacteroidota bacterium]
MKSYLPLIATGLVFMACTPKNELPADNPFAKDWETPYGVPDFGKIKTAHFEPAFMAGMDQQLTEIDSIATNPDAPTFDNTIGKMEKSGQLLKRVAGVFFNLTGVLKTDSLSALEEKISPLLSAHSDNILLNEKLFARIKSLYDQRESLQLTEEQAKLLENKYKEFVRNGANLSKQDQDTLRKINEKLATLGVKFGNNVQKEDNNYQIVLKSEEELAGLPPAVRQAGTETAKEKGLEGSYVYTVQRPSMYPFLTYSERRDLREKLYTAYIERANHNDEFDNKENVREIVNLRLKRANLLGYPTHSAYVLEDRMAKNPENVYKLLNQLWPAALKRAGKERDDMQKLIDNEGKNFKLASWDWWYYAEKVKQAQYNLNEEEIRPYLKVDNVINGTFILANKLWGVTFEEVTNLPKYHPDVRTYLVKNEKGDLIGIYLSDWYYRDTKRFGAWMNNIRDESRMDGNHVIPIIVNVGNFTKPTADAPALLSADDASTLFHEFGHAVHGLLTECVYPSISGTSTPRDFVEFPSQVLENWVFTPEMLSLYATHYKTGEVMPSALIEKIKKASQFNQGFATTEYLAASLLDMDYHTLTQPLTGDITAFEKASLDKNGMIPEVISRYRSTYYNHIFSDPIGYSSGYYSYIWSEVLDADAWTAFKEKGIFDQATAKAYRDNILAKGGTRDAMEMYKAFRGREPEIAALIAKRGLN